MNIIIPSLTLGQFHTDPFPTPPSILMYDNDDAATAARVVRLLTSVLLLSAVQQL